MSADDPEIERFFEAERAEHDRYIERLRKGTSAAWVAVAWIAGLLDAGVVTLSVLLGTFLVKDDLEAWVAPTIIFIAVLAGLSSVVKHQASRHG